MPTIRLPVQAPRRWCLFLFHALSSCPPLVVCTYLRASPFFLFSLSRFFHFLARLSNCKSVRSSNFTMLFWQWCCFGCVSGCGCCCTADHHSNVVALSHSIVVVAFQQRLVFKKPSLNNLLGDKEGPAPSHPVRLSPFPPAAFASWAEHRAALQQTAEINASPNL
jgi:hypothetical protein